MSCADCARLVELQDEVALLRSLLEPKLREAEISRIQLRLGISPQQAKILWALASSKGRIMSIEEINAALPDATHGGDRLTNHISVQVCRLRKKLGFDAIDNVWGRGFRLSTAGLALFKSLEDEQVAA